MDIASIAGLIGGQSAVVLTVLWYEYKWIKKEQKRMEQLMDRHDECHTEIRDKLDKLMVASLKRDGDLESRVTGLEARAGIGGYR